MIAFIDIARDVLHIASSIARTEYSALSKK